VVEDIMNIFLVSSAIETSRGIFSHEERMEQTLKTFESIKKKVPNSAIVTYESGVTLSDKNRDILNKHANLVCLQSVKEIMDFSKHNMNSRAEALSTYVILNSIQNQLPKDVKRIFKLSGRYVLQDEFDINAYDNIGDKFVFVKRKKTWMNEEMQKHLNVDSLFDTRLYSFTPNLIDYFKSRLGDIFVDTGLGLDLEHSIYKNIDKNLVVEFDRVYCEGRLAPNGTIQID